MVRKGWISHIIILLILFLCSSATAQKTQEVYCIDHNFQKEVDRYLNYTVGTITVADAQFKSKEYVFLDARELEEYDISHIPEAVHIGYDHFDLSKINDYSKDTKFIVYCSIGYRSEKIGEKLLKAGFLNVFNLYGSIFEWANQKHPLVNKYGTTSEIHTYNKRWSKWVSNKDVVKVW